jgi:hypothetical protein
MLAQMVYDSLIAAGKTAFLTIYPGYDSNGDSVVNGSDDGHELFFIVQNPYWTDVINFLNANTCNTTGLNEISTQESFIIYPNPFPAQTTLQTAEQLNNAILTVYNLHGQTIKEIKNISGQTVVLSWDNLTSGLYFVRLTENSKIIAIKKIIITD